MFDRAGAAGAAVGLVVLVWLDDKPATARWLNAAEKAQLQRAVGDADVQPLPWRQELKVAFTQQGLWPIIVGYLFLAGAANIFGLWGPQFLQDILATDVKGIGTTFGAIFLVATVAMAAFGALADRGGWRETILLALLAASAVAFFVAAFAGSATTAVVAVGVGVVCYMSCFPVFWGSITPRLAPAAAAAAIALINSVGNLGGAIGPALVGPIKQHLGLAPSIATLGVFMSLAAVLLAALRRR